MILAGDDLDTGLSGSVKICSRWASSDFWNTAVTSGIISGSSWATGNFDSSLDTRSRLSSVYGSLGARRTLLSVKIPNGILCWAVDTLFAIEEWFGNLTISNIIIRDRSLEIFLDHIIQCLVTQNPVGGIKVCLPDSSTKNDLGAALFLDDRLDVLKEKGLGL